MNIFISWRGSDRDVKNEVVAALREGLKNEDDIVVWESDEFCTEDFSEECMEAIERSQIFVLLLSEAAMEPCYVINEVIKARKLSDQGRLNIVIYKITDAPYKSNFEMNLNHLSYVTPTLGGIDAVVNRTRYLLALRKRGTPEKPYDVKEPMIAAPSVGKNPFFAKDSRTAEFAALGKALEDSPAVFVSGLPGYGRTSTVKEFLTSSGAYRTTAFLHGFCGTVRDFFLYGLRFSNIHSGVYDEMNEQQILLYQTEQLKKFKKDTVIVVPNVTADADADAFLFDTLAGLSCRILFITTSVPRPWAERFPVVTVDRMPDAGLTELFFRFFPETDGAQRQALLPPLSAFFDRVSGHTKTVEVAASVLADDDFLDPASLPDVLSRLGTDTADGNNNGDTDGDGALSHRILDTLSAVFDIHSFDEKSRAILYAASLTLSLPLPRKKFALLLRDAGIYDRDTLGKLIANHWIESDPASGTLSVHPLIAAVCAKKLTSDVHVAAVCLDTFGDDFADVCLTKNICVSQTPLRRLQLLCRALGFSAYEEALRLLANAFMNGYCDEAETRGLSARLSEEKAVVAKTYAGTEMPSVYSENTTMVTQVLERVNIPALVKSTGNGNAIGTMMTFPIRDMADVLLHSLWEQPDDDYVGNNGDFDDDGDTDEYDDEIFYMRLYDLLDHVRESPDVSDTVSFLLEFGTLLLSEKEKSGNDADKAALCANLLRLSLGIYGQILVTAFRMNRRLFLMLVRQREKLVAATGGLSAIDDYLAYKHWFDALRDMSAYTAETKQVFEKMLSVYAAYRKEVADSDPPDSDICAEIRQYCEMAKKNGDTDEAVNALRYYDTLSIPLTTETVPEILRAVAVPADALIRVGEAEDAIELLNGPLFGRLGQFLEEHSFDASLTTARAEWEELTTIAKVLRHPDIPVGFSDEKPEHQTYYDTYEATREDRHLYRRYSEIAQKAQNIDFSLATREEILAQMETLRRRAGRGEPMEALMPTAFALTSEAGYRVLGYRYHFVQLVAAAAMAEGRIAEMRNGEGKTYTIVAVAVLSGLYGKNVHIADASDYLTLRNYRWMKGVYEYLGVPVYYAEDNRDPIRETGVLYATVKTLVFGQMNALYRGKTNIFQCEVLIADEADSMAITDALQNYTLSLHQKDVREIYDAAFGLLSSIPVQERNRFVAIENGRVRLKEEIYRAVPAFFHKDIDALPAEEAALIEAALIEAARVLYVYRSGVDYFLRRRLFATEVVHEDHATGKFTGFPATVTYLILKKENRRTAGALLVSDECFDCLTAEHIRSYELFTGTTATAESMEKEFADIYEKKIFPIPANAPVVRTDNDPVVFIDRESKSDYVCGLVAEKNRIGQPVLLVVSDIAELAEWEKRLRERGIRPTVLSAKNEEEEEAMLSEAGTFGRVTLATMLVNRGADILLGGDPFFPAKKELYRLCESGDEVSLICRAATDPVTRAGLDEHQYRLCERYVNMVTYHAIRTESDKQRVIEAGGLCVIGTECFDDIRTEIQLRGRAGRQGQRGESHVVYSLDDPPLALLIGDRLTVLRQLLSNTAAGIPLDSGILLKAIHRSRLSLQNAYYSRVNRHPAILYYKDAKETFRRANRELADLPWRDFLKKYFFSRPDVLRAARSPSDERGNREVRAALYGVFGETMPRLSFRDTQAAETLTAAYAATVGERAAVPADEGSAKTIRAAVCVYYRRMTVEVRAMDCETVSTQTEARKLSAISEKLCDQILTEQIAKALGS